MIAIFFSDMWALGTIIMITGGTSGWLNSGITSLFLTTWGPEKSRPYIASFHFTFSIGAILAPFLVGLYKDLVELKVDFESDGLLRVNFNQTNKSLTIHLNAARIKATIVPIMEHTLTHLLFKVIFNVNRATCGISCVMENISRLIFKRPHIWTKIFYATTEL